MSKLGQEHFEEESKQFNDMIQQSMEQKAKSLSEKIQLNLKQVQEANSVGNTTSNLTMNSTNATSPLNSTDGSKKEIKKRYVHLFPHSHTDEGWIAKSDDFFYGTDTSIYPGSVRDILDTTMLELLKNPNRTFVYAEVRYFKLWWSLQDAKMKEKVRWLIQKG
jgi:hypothetical protein